MIIRFIPIRSQDQIESLAAMADDIWHEYFPVILSGGQIDYMVQTFQSAQAIAEQMARQGYLYYFLELDGTDIGYTSIREDHGSLFLSKLYLRKEYRGQGYAGEAFRFFEELCREMNLSSIWLTVNRHNVDTIHVYERKGFQTVRTQVTDIGSGFVMDDFVMEKRLDAPTPIS